jgi:hypothetical protein
MFPYDDATLKIWRKKPLIFLVNFLGIMFRMHIQKFDLQLRASFFLALPLF